jgi:hypothetical protein
MAQRAEVRVIYRQPLAFSRLVYDLCMPLRLAALVACAVALSGQTQPKDVDGWDKIKWGMTIAEARAAYNVTAEPEVNEYWTILTLTSVEIGDIKWNASARVKRGQDGISGVSLFSSEPTSTSFDTLKALLIQKYGSPASTETKMGGLNGATKVTTVLWSLPSTSIFLIENQWSRGTLTVDYKATDKKALDKL